MKQTGMTQEIRDIISLVRDIFGKNDEKSPLGAVDVYFKGVNIDIAEGRIPSVSNFCIATMKYANAQANMMQENGGISKETKKSLKDLQKRVMGLAMTKVLEPQVLPPQVNAAVIDTTLASKLAEAFQK